MRKKEKQQEALKTREMESRYISQLNRKDDLRSYDELPVKNDLSARNTSRLQLPIVDHYRS